MLYEKGLNINILDRNNNNILLLAAKQGVKNNLRYVKKLIELGADPNLCNLNNESFYTECKKQALEDESFVSVFNENIGENVKKSNHRSERLKNRYINTIITAVLILIIINILKIGYN